MKCSQLHSREISSLLFTGLCPDFAEEKYFVQGLENISRKIFPIIKQQERNTFLNSYSIAAPSNSLNVIFYFKWCYETSWVFKGISKAALQTELLKLTSKALSMWPAWYSSKNKIKSSRR